MVKILNSSNETLAILNNVTNTIKTEALNREFTFAFTTVIDMDKSQYITYTNKVEVEDNYFNIVYFKKNRTMDNITLDISCEHVSYDLLSANFTAGFTATGVFSAVATTVLSGTGFTFGTVEITASQTISINEATNGRNIMFQLAALYGGELKFDKYAISLLTRRGADNGVQFRYRKNISSASVIVDNRKKVGGLPTISYEVDVAELEFEQGYISKGYSSLEHYELGDTIRVIDEDLDIDISLRIVKESHDPEQRMQGTVEISNFVDDISDTLTQIQTTTVAKDATYNGCRIGPIKGFEAERSDGKAITIMNATEGISIYSDTGSGLVRNFFVDTDGRIKASEIDISGSGTFAGTVTIGTGDNVFVANGAEGIWLGNAVFADAPFKVNLAGAATATNAYISGTIEGSAIIGGTIEIGTGNNVFKADTNGIYLGNAVFANAPFKVAMNGAATATNLTVTGGTITIGTGDNVFKVDSNGIYLGNAVFADAPFKVTVAGDVTVPSTVTIGETDDATGDTKALNFFESTSSGNVAYIEARRENFPTDKYVNLVLSAYDITLSSFNIPNISGDDIATQPWVSGQGYLTGTSITGGSFTTTDGKTVSYNSDGLITGVI